MGWGSISSKASKNSSEIERAFRQDANTVLMLARQPFAPLPGRFSTGQPARSGASGIAPRGPRQSGARPPARVPPRGAFLQRGDRLRPLPCPGSCRERVPVQGARGQRGRGGRSGRAAAPGPSRSGCGASGGGGGRRAALRLRAGSHRSGEGEAARSTPTAPTPGPSSPRWEGARGASAARIFGGGGERGPPASRWGPGCRLGIGGEAPGKGEAAAPGPAGGRGGGRPAGAGCSCIGGCGEGGGQEAGGQGEPERPEGGVSANRVGGFSTEGERKVCGAGGEGAAKRAGPGAGPAAAALGRGAAAGGPPLDFCRGGGIAPSFSSPQG